MKLLQWHLRTYIHSDQHSDKAKDKLQTAMRRLQKLNDKFNVAEGIVIMYKGRRMKFTGSFAALNQALGTRFELE